MQYRFDWRVPKRVLLLTISGDVSLEELRQFNQSLLRYLEEGDGTEPVHIVSIGDNIRRVPTNLMQIKEIVTFVQHPNMGWTVIVQERANPLTGFMLSVAAQATGMKMRQVKNINDGLETLQRLDSSIETLTSAT